MGKIGSSIKNIGCSLFYHLFDDSYIGKMVCNSRRIYTVFKVKNTVKSFELPMRIKGGVVLTKQTTLGKNVAIADRCRVSGSGDVYIGDNTHFGHDVLIISDIHNYESPSMLPYDHTKYVKKKVVIENNVWIGDRAVILGDVTIGEGAVVQANSTVVRDVPRCAVVGGSPAKVFKYRDIGQYELLEKEKKFEGL